MSLFSFLESFDPSITPSVGEQALLCRDQREGHTIKPTAIAAPHTTQQISRILKYCAEHRIPVITQGGNTGLVGASIPQKESEGLLLSLRNMNRIRHFDQFGGIIVAEAGITLAQLRRYCAKHGYSYPLTLAPEERCTLGGNLATNAGGMGAQRYGTMRTNCLGLEFVLSDGRIIDRIQPFLKQNAGYELSQLIIGSEGTLAVITAASIRLYPHTPKSQRTLVWFQTIDEALSVIARVRATNPALLSIAEVLHRNCLTALPVARFGVPRIKDSSEWLCFLEFDDYPACRPQLDLILKSLKRWSNSSHAEETQAIWNVRCNLSKLQSEAGYALKFDLSVPLSSMGAFLQETLGKIKQDFPQWVPLPFGHLADGNIHFDILSLAQKPQDTESIRRFVIDTVLRYKGTICAEHGIGKHQFKLELTRSPEDIQIMKAIRKVLDPYEILNPKVLF